MTQHERYAELWLRPPTSLPISPWMDEVTIVPHQTSLARMEQNYQDVEHREGALDFHVEADVYFKDLHDAQPEYYDFISTFEHEMSNRWPVNGRSTTVAIAAASHEEHDKLYSTLEQFARNRVENDHEVVVFLNRPAAIGDMQGQRTFAAMRRFMDDYPDFPVRVFSHIFDHEEPIGKIKRILHDTVALRHHRANSDDPFMVLCDADTIDLSSDFVTEMTLPMKKDLLIDSVAGHLDWDREAFRNHPELHFATRLYQLIDHTLHYRDNRKVTPGAATAIRLSTYCAIKGTVEDSRGEDVALGIAISKMRGGWHTITYPGPDCVLHTSARRSIAALQNGLAPNEKWRMDFRAKQPDIRLAGAKIARNTQFNMLGGLALSERLRFLGLRVIVNYPGGHDPALYENALVDLGVAAKLGPSPEHVSFEVFDPHLAISTIQSLKGEYY
ncbi:MAG TPA: hypothetical protein VLG92_02790 [Candidatus Saccharimonadia bacterium]|nr:hypothetical protein [Candidatus Saccharimonadia bacterium]